MVFEQSLEVLGPELAEQEPVDPGTEFLEGTIGWREDGPTGVSGFVDGVEEAGLDEAEGQGAEVLREQGELGEGCGRGYQKGVEAVDNAVGGELTGKKLASLYLL